MSAGEFCNRDVVVIEGNESVRVAGELMRRHHVGDVVIVEERGGKRIPVGIVTDRDLVVEVVVPGLWSDDLAVRDVVTDPLLTALETDGLHATVRRMRERGVRRVPVVDGGGALVGILTVDDVIGLMAGLLDDLTALVSRQQQREQRRRP